MSNSGDHPDAIACPGCAYNLFGISSDHCPECGLEIDRSAMGTSVLPWTHRRKIGRARAFFRTANLAAFRSRKIAQDMNCPVSYADARKFRYLCILTVWVPLTAGMAIWAAVGELFNAPAWERIVGWASIAISSWLFLLAVTGMPSLFFHPRSLPILRQNRAVALSYYASSAALAWMWIPAIVLGVGLLVAFHTDTFDGTAMTGILIAFAGGLAVLYLVGRLAISAGQLLQPATHCSGLRVWTMEIVLLASWLFLANVVLIGIPFETLYVAVVVASLV